ncbi:hypothetical protein [Pseudoalteromonas rubra]|uniref:hypothetical protein n=1 Tax=Pseudoalteromonas rubra TaxID=43658 RepID=UPI000F7B6836|nr:hypothetical protein [Pseudoalteromonas rubra]
MRELGVCKSSGRLYEGSCNSGIPVVNFFPLLPVEFIGVDKPNSISEFDGYRGHIFREESFDPITKIRRGFIYRLNDYQPVIWRVQDPGRKDLVESAWAKGAAQELEAISYQIDALSYLRCLNKSPRVVLGEEPFQSFWKVLAIETQFDGKPILTLKAMSSFGAVPELIPEQLPDDCKALLITKVENVETAANRLGAIETVDACRNALSVVFGSLAGDLKLDLGAGISKRICLNKEKGNSNGQDLLTHTAEIVRRLHSRGKANEMVKHETRPISEEDANLALNCFWFVLVELGWAKSA